MVKKDSCGMIARDVSKDFLRTGSSTSVFTAVRPLNLELEPGLILEITGRSGSGKTTLLNMLAGLLTPTAGGVFLGETDLYALDEEARARLRNEKIGFIPQGHTALRSLTVLENVLLPSVLYTKGKLPEDRAKEYLTRVGLAPLMEEKPDALSGGELRRMALVRALIMMPQIILADEPTAGLDMENTRETLALLREVADHGAAVLLVTHEDEAAGYADRVYIMENGALLQD